MKRVFALACCLGLLGLTALIGLAVQAPETVAETTTTATTPAAAATLPSSVEALPVFQVASSHCSDVVFTASSFSECYQGCEDRGCGPGYFDSSTNCCFCSDML